MTVQILTGDCRELLRTLPDESVHCVVTSPPYWGLRDYGVAGQIGLETGIDAWLQEIVNVFAEVHRILRGDGTLWLQLGDCHRNKQLIGQPWRAALALQSDGWLLRQEIIWHKPNPAPETVYDRPTTAHEHLFLFAKQARYFYDHGAVKEACGDNSHARRSMKHPDGWDTGIGSHGNYHRQGREKGRTRLIGVGPKSVAGRGAGIRTNDSYNAALIEIVDTRNKRSVWTIPLEAFKGAHFATFPQALVEPCILAGCPISGTVLDPFAGAGTTLMVADRLGRNAIGIELSPEYTEMAARRCREPGFALAAEYPSVAHARPAPVEDLPLLRPEAARPPGGSDG